jgi:hypothetical protein
LKKKGDKGVGGRWRMGRLEIRRKTAESGGVRAREK